MAGSHELNLTAECISDIADPITRISELSTSRRLTSSNFQRQIRGAEIPTHKSAFTLLSERETTPFSP